MRKHLLGATFSYNAIAPHVARARHLADTTWGDYAVIEWSTAYGGRRLSVVPEAYTRSDEFVAVDGVVVFDTIVGWAREDVA